MRSNSFKSTLIRSGLAASVLLLASGVALAQSTVNLTAAPTTTTLPDGQTVPMWGYTCGGVTGLPARASDGRRCDGNWTPPRRSRYGLAAAADHGAGGQTLTINLTNNLTFGGRSQQDPDLAGDRRPARRRPGHRADTRSPEPDASRRRARPGRDTGRHDRSGRHRVHAARPGRPRAVVRDRSRGRGGSAERR